MNLTVVVRLDLDLCVYTSIAQLFSVLFRTQEVSYHAIVGRSDLESKELIVENSTQNVFQIRHSCCCNLVLTLDQS